MYGIFHKAKKLPTFTDRSNLTDMENISELEILKLATRKVSKRYPGLSLSKTYKGTDKVKLDQPISVPLKAYVV